MKVSFFNRKKKKMKDKAFIISYHSRH